MKIDLSISELLTINTAMYQMRERRIGEMRLSIRNPQQYPTKIAMKARIDQHKGVIKKYLVLEKKTLDAILAICDKLYKKEDK